MYNVVIVIDWPYPLPRERLAMRFYCENISTHHYIVYDNVTRNSFLFSMRNSQLRLMRQSRAADEFTIKDATRFVLAYIWNYPFNEGALESAAKRVN